MYWDSDIWLYDLVNWDVYFYVYLWMAMVLGALPLEMHRFWVPRAFRVIWRCAILITGCTTKHIRPLYEPNFLPELTKTRLIIISSYQ